MGLFSKSPVDFDFARPCRLVQFPIHPVCATANNTSATTAMAAAAANPAL
jgi:hypothetical protein